MKKIFTEIAFAMMLVICCASCEKELGGNIFSSEGAITATIIDDGSKVDYSAGSTAIALNWSAGDEILLSWGSGSDSIKCKINSSSSITNGGKNAVFSIEPEYKEAAANIGNGATVYAIYRPSLDGITVSGGQPVINFDFTNQSGELINDRVIIDSESHETARYSSIRSANVLCATTQVKDDKIYLQFKSVFSVFGFAKVTGLEAGVNYVFSLSFTDNTIKTAGTYTYGGSYNFNTSSQSVSATRTADSDGKIENLFFSLPTGIDLSKMKFSISRTDEDGGQPIMLASSKTGTTGTSAAGVCYMKQAEFFCKNAWALPGEFSISEYADEKIQFSPGNLQYKYRTKNADGTYSDAKIWRFAEHQWDFIGGVYNSALYSSETVIDDENKLCSNIDCYQDKFDYKIINSQYSGWIDLLPYGTSGLVNGYPNPYLVYNGNTNYTTMPISGTDKDWGYAAIQNGGNGQNMWHTLEGGEWEYLLNERGAYSYAPVRIKIKDYQNIEGEVNGVLLFPDGWQTSDWPISGKTPAYKNMSTYYQYGCLELTAEEFKTIERLGVVLLPETAGTRGTDANGSVSLSYTDTRDHLSYYWTSTYDYVQSGVKKSCLKFFPISPSSSVSFFGLAQYTAPQNGLAVRLVTKKYHIDITDRTSAGTISLEYDNSWDTSNNQ